MKNILKDAIDSEPLFKYPILLIKWSLLIGFYAVWFSLVFVWELITAILDSPSPNQSEAEKQSKWLIDCALQEQWKERH